MRTGDSNQTEAAVSGTASGGTGGVWNGGVVAGLCLTIIINLALISLFHDRSWIPADDGHYVHVASRLVQGEVLNADVEELHPGYVHFIHAWSLRLFGDDLVSLRYPLMAMVFFQSMLIFVMFVPLGTLRAVASASAISAIGTFQISNPTTSLYALFGTVALIVTLTRISPVSSRRYVIAGFLCMVVFLFRQLTGIFVVMGMLAFLLLEDRGGRTSGVRGVSGWPAKALVGVMFGGLTGYLLQATDISGFLLFGVWPLGVLAMSWRRTTLTFSALLAILAKLSAGAAAALLPLFAYHIAHGSLGAWFRDAFIRSLAVADLEHIRVSKFYHYVLVGFYNIFQGGDLDSRVNGLFWFVLPLLTAVLGVWVWRLLRTPRGVGVSLVLPILALFNAVVSAFNQIPFYLYLSAGLTMVALLGLSSNRGARSLIVHAAAALLCVIGLMYQAGQPYTRNFKDIVNGVRINLVPSPLERNGLWIDPTEAARYQQLVALIHEETDEGEAIFALPNNADVYYLADRPNPFRLFNPTLSLANESEVDAFLDEFDRIRPKLLVHNRTCAYNTVLTKRLLDGLSSAYVSIAEVGSFEIYRRLDVGMTDTGAPSRAPVHHVLLIAR